MKKSIVLFVFIIYADFYVVAV